MNKLEALADAIISVSGYLNPESETYSVRNPGALKAVSPRHIRTNSGLRVFNKALDGYAALLYDLETKCKGDSRSGVTEESTLEELCHVMGFIDGTAKEVAKFLNKASSYYFDVSTKLGYFLEE